MPMPMPMHVPMHVPMPMHMHMPMHMTYAQVTGSGTRSQGRAKRLRRSSHAVRSSLATDPLAALLCGEPRAVLVLYRLAFHTLNLNHVAPLQVPCYPVRCCPALIGGATCTLP
jgi:hypothetical protein